MVLRNIIYYGLNLWFTCVIIFRYYPNLIMDDSLSNNLNQTTRTDHHTSYKCGKTSTFINRTFDNMPCHNFFHVCFMLKDSILGCICTKILYYKFRVNYYINETLTISSTKAIKLFEFYVWMGYSNEVCTV